MAEDIATAMRKAQGQSCDNRNGASLRISHNPAMDNEWIRAGLKKPGKSQAGLARAMGINPSGVNRLLNNARQLKASEIEKVRAYLDGLTNEREPNGSRQGGKPAYQAPGNDRLEVLGMAEAGPDGWSLWNGDIIDTINRPANLTGVPNAYAVYITGTSMEPRYIQGELVHIHPGKPVTIGSFVLVQKKPKAEGEPSLAIIKRLVKRSGNRVILAQFNPEKTFELKADEIIMHRIVGSGEA